ncbi:MAG: peptide ABC transporter ATP-binding protein, partial [Actinomycetota bacterium]
MRLVPSPPGRIAGGSITLDGAGDLVQLREKDMRKIRGSKIAMIFQEPMTSLNPVYTIGDQIGEALKLHLDMNRREARDRTLELLEQVQIRNPKDTIDEFPHRF